MFRIGVITAIVFLILPISAAFGHVGVEPSRVESGQGTTISFRIGHGCDHQATTSVSVRIPAGVVSVQPFPKPGWELTVETGTLASPVETGSQTFAEGVTTVTWSGGSLEDAHTDVFQIRATVYGDAGDTIYFPVVQGCGEAEHAWIEVPVAGQDAHALSSPAPAVVIAGDEDPGGDTLTQVALGLGVLATLLGILALLRRRT